VLLATSAIWSAVTTPIAIRFSPNRPPSLIWRASAPSMSAWLTSPRAISISP